MARSSAKLENNVSNTQRKGSTPRSSSKSAANSATKSQRKTSEGSPVKLEKKRGKVTPLKRIGDATSPSSTKLQSHVPKKKAAPVRKKKRRVAANGHKLPDPFPAGEIMVDVYHRQWRLGESIGFGGFGEIYLASDKINQPVGPNATYVIKVEDHSNGPLFSEMHFYHRVGKTELIDEWMKKKKLNFLGMPRFIGNGSHERKNGKYRFMVMDRFGEDLQKVLERCGGQFPLKAVYTVAIKILDILEYVHQFGYIHADVKPSNLLLGFGQDAEKQIYLVDFGLACKFMVDGKHKEYKEDLRKAHDGTIEYTSRDAHIGAHARRSDLEILGYNLVHWLSGKLPWEDCLKNPTQVAQQKNKSMANIPEFLKFCFHPATHPPGIAEYLRYVAQLGFEDAPNYNLCRDILRTAIRKAGYKDDGLVTFNTELPRRNNSSTPKQQQPRGVKRKSDQELSPAKKHKPLPTSVTTPKKPMAKRKATASAPGLHRPHSKATAAARSPAGALDNPTPAMLEILKRRKEGGNAVKVEPPKESTPPPPPSRRAQKHSPSPSSLANTKGTRSRRLPAKLLDSVNGPP